MEGQGGEGQNGQTPGQGTGDWRDGISEELRGSPALKDIPDLETLAKNHVDLQGHLGNSLRIPGPDAADEDIQGFHQKLMEKVPDLMVKPNLEDAEQSGKFYSMLGRPDSPDGYELPEFEGGAEANEEFVKTVRAEAHSLNLTGKQFKQYVKSAVERSHQAITQQNQAHQEDIKGLMTEWGPAFEQNIGDAVHFAEQTGAPQAFLDWVKGGQADSGTLKWLQQLSANTGERVNAKGDPITRIDSVVEMEEQVKEINRKVQQLLKEGDKTGAAELSAKGAKLRQEINKYRRPS